MNKERFECPVRHCPWVHDEPMAEVPESALAGVFGPGVMSKVAATQRMQRIEDALKGHLGTHSTLEFVKTITFWQETARDMMKRWGKEHVGPSKEKAIVGESGPIKTLTCHRFGQDSVEIPAEPPAVKIYGRVMVTEDMVGKIIEGVEILAAGGGPGGKPIHDPSSDLYPEARKIADAVITRISGEGPGFLPKPIFSLQQMIYQAVVSVLAPQPLEQDAGSGRATLPADPP